MRIDNRLGLPAGDTEDPVLVAEPREGVPEVVDREEELAAAAAALARGSAPIALDVERAQGFRYGADPYLVQIRREDVGTFLIDAHALPDLSSLGRGVDGVWILHDAAQDLRNLVQTGLEPRDLFDTEIAARLLGLERFGLAAVAQQVLGLDLAKDHQASDWSVRPLPPDWLRYAALDVELLTELYRRMSVDLERLGRWEWAEQEFRHILALPEPVEKPDRWRTVPGAGKIRTRRGLAVLRNLWEAREAVARDLDLAPGRLVRNQALVRAAQQPPRNRRELLALGEFRSPKARPYADLWLRAVRRATLLEERDLPPRHADHLAGSIPDARQWARLDPQAHERLTAVRTAVGAVAGPLAMSPEVVLEPRDQRFLAWAPLEDALPVAAAVEERLAESHARPWQIALMRGPLAQALSH